MTSVGISISFPRVLRIVMQGRHVGWFSAEGPGGPNMGLRVLMVVVNLIILLINIDLSRHINSSPGSGSG